MAPRPVRAFLLAATALAGFAATPGHAQSTDDQRLQALEQQIHAMQGELRRLQKDIAARDAAAKAAAATPAPVPVAAPSPASPGPHPQGTAGAQAVSAPSPEQPSGGGLVLGPVPRSRVIPPVLEQNLPGPHPPQTAGAQAASTVGPMGMLRVGGVTITLGGYVELTGLFRSSNEVADIGSSWSGIPFPYQPTQHENEFRMSARGSRVSALVQGDLDPGRRLSAFVESDFMGVGTTSNSVQTNGYALRLRQAYGAYDDGIWGLHVLAGQAWSLLTLNRVGIIPRQENVPLTIDTQYMPGFTFARQPELRVVKEFDNHRVWLGLSLEAPQTTYFTGPNGIGVPSTTSVNLTNPGGSGLNATTIYSDDIAPDVIAKIAFDPVFGHFEATGILRFLHDRVSTPGGGTNNTALGYGGGLGAILPIFGGKGYVQASFLAGAGIGRYGAGQLPDATVSTSGTPQPLPEVQALLGVVDHPIPSVDLYAYVGTERVGARYSDLKGKGFGYGSPLYDNAGCEIELSAATTCVANTSALTQGTLGGWWRFLQSSAGTLQVGAQYSYTRRNIFSGVGGAPSANENVVMVNLRYLPFQ